MSFIPDILLSMKKIISTLIVLLGISYVSAASTCVDVKGNLSRGNKTSSVTSLQNFLTQKGFLKTTVNGVFDENTISALKDYQKSVGLSQTGSTGPKTREAIKKATCSSTDISKPKVCAKDVKVCPDGKTLSRSLPDCSFASCSLSNKTTKTATSTAKKVRTQTSSVAKTSNVSKKVNTNVNGVTNPTTFKINGLQNLPGLPPLPKLPTLPGMNNLNR